MDHPLSGDVAPEFEAVSTSGRDVRIPGRSLTKVTVVGFWASWCPTCQATMPRLADLYNDTKGDGVLVVGVSEDETETAAVAGARDLGLSFPVVMDSSQSLASRYGASKVPLTFVVDRAGRVRWVGRAPGQARAAVRAVLGE